MSCISAGAAELPEYDLSGIYNSLSDEAKQHMISLGADSADVNALGGLSFESVMSEIGSIAAENAATPMRALVTVTALLLLCSILSAYKSSLSGEIGGTLNIAAALGIACVLAAPAVTVINDASGVIFLASQLMLEFAPVMAVLMATSGQAAGAAGYYAAVMAAGEGVNALCAQVVVPFMNLFLGLGLVSNLSPDIRLGGFASVFAKSARWLLAFVMSVFTSVLAIRQAVTTALDNVGNRAARFALSSFIPVVGGALSEAYQTVQGSVSLLKSGVGIFVIIALLVTFLPLVLRLLLWVAALWLGKSAAEVLGLSQCAALLDVLGLVFLTLLSVALCVLAVYVICAALVLMMGGGGG